MDFDFIRSATSKELEQFKSVCNQLLSRTYIVRTLFRPGKGRVNNPERLNHKKSSHICKYIDGLDFKNQDNYPKLMNETIDLAVKMRDVLKKYI